MLAAYVQDRRFANIFEVLARRITEKMAEKKTAHAGEFA
jgi:hypothetical protein